MNRTEFERCLADCGRTFHAGLGEFRDGSRVTNFDDVVRLLPGLTADEVAAWSEDKMNRAERSIGVMFTD
jgi:hypothetical protein